jgi:hypothetical protein
MDAAVNGNVHIFISKELSLLLPSARLATNLGASACFFRPINEDAGAALIGLHAPQC